MTGAQRGLNGGEHAARAAYARLRDLLIDNPQLAERTSDMLNGDLPCPDLEEAMGNDVQITLRVPADLLDRADALVPAMEGDDEINTLTRVARSTVLRLALLRGLQNLERKYLKPAALPPKHHPPV